VNQKFVHIPFLKFVKMLEYKSRLAGIAAERVREDYSSKRSFIDGEVPCQHGICAGKRVERGLFRAGNGRLINADVNGALNIMMAGLIARRLAAEKNAALKDLSRGLSKVPFEVLLEVYSEVFRKVFLDTDQVKVCSAPVVYTVKK
jgi:transposase